VSVSNPGVYLRPSYAARVVNKNYLTLLSVISQLLVTGDATTDKEDCHVAFQTVNALGNDIDDDQHKTIPWKRDIYLSLCTFEN